MAEVSIWYGKEINLPVWQLPALHSLCCADWPRHGSPPSIGGGLLHCLILTLYPFPQVTEQSCQASHDPQLPFAK